MPRMSSKPPGRLNPSAFRPFLSAIIGTFLCAADRDGAAQQLATQRGWEVPTEEVLRMPSMLIGEAGAMADHLQQVRDQLGISYFVVRDAQINAAAEVVCRLTR
jgi:hypothetical protein